MPAGWRITKATRAATAFDGEGARLHGGRWNSPGMAVVYTAGSQSLAVLELLVHLQASRLLAAYVSIRATFDTRLVETIDTTAMPPNWRRYPAPVALRQIGDRWIAERRSAILQLPSAIVQAESNYLLNPQHPDFRSVVIARAEPFELDSRLK